ncbi:hypothetical protein [Paenibacillus glycinis]|uniref:Uncharacterized protein n=1 Tax=Paenibacillus glycinis TaxID=2697035 RepID=A0ABW9XQX3_9BACL|nr:hypothetical protein [Paenibacillus glycinis]NBD25015.1 hypothetical protein [Paenibacillus glycinis]
MRKWIPIALLVATLLVACLCPLLHAESASDDNYSSGPAITAGGDDYGFGAIELGAAKNGSDAPHVLFSFVFLLLLLSSSFPESWIKLYFRSPVPILKRFYVLNPVRFQSRYMSSLSVHL